MLTKLFISFFPIGWVDFYDLSSWSLKDFDAISTPIGTGSFGAVYKAKVRTEEKVKTEEKDEKPIIVALKVLLKKNLEDNKAKIQLRREVKIQMGLKHPNILRLYGHFEENERVFLILEYADKGSLFSAMKNEPNKRFAEPKAVKFIIQASSALEYCHSKQVIH